MLPTASFKDLCLDTTQPHAAAEFWAPALGLQIAAVNDNYSLRDGVAEHLVWLNAVPETKTVKNRVHLDVLVGAVAELVAQGASILDESEGWTVMADPEGAEFCAFVRKPEEVPDYRLYELVVDAADPAAICAWWAARFGVEPQSHPDDPWHWLSEVPGMDWPMVFNPVPEPKTVKNRVHWDVWGSPADFLEAGATLLRAKDYEIAWDVLADPEGNEFCVFAPRESSVPVQ